MLSLVDEGDHCGEWKGLVFVLARVRLSDLPLWYFGLFLHLRLGFDDGDDSMALKTMVRHPRVLQARVLAAQRPFRRY